MHETALAAEAALAEALGQAVGELSQIALWKRDLKPWNHSQDSSPESDTSPQPKSPQPESPPTSQAVYNIELDGGQRIQGYLVTPVEIKIGDQTLQLSADELASVSRPNRDAQVWAVDTKDGFRYQAVLTSLKVAMPGVKDPVAVEVAHVLRVSRVAELPPDTNDEGWTWHGPPVRAIMPVRHPLRDKLVFARGFFLVPLRPVLQWLGLAGSLRMVKEKNRTSYVFQTASGTVRLTVGQVAVQVDGRRLHLPTPPIAQQGTLLVPSDFFWLALELPTGVNREQAIVRILNRDQLCELAGK
ncbi:MAG: stalk domain-containing protein [Armatimonadota bacterium]